MGELQSQEFEYSAGGVEMQGYLAWDRTLQGRRPGVLVVHEWWGNNAYSRRRADMLAELGYTAMAVDMYGDGRTADDPDGAGKLMNELLSDLGVVRERFDAAAERLREHESVDGSSVAAIGYCMGGGIVLHMARYGRELRAVASFHGSLGLGIAPAGEGGEIAGRVAVYHGEADALVGEGVVTGFRDQMREIGADLLFVPLPGAKHGFTNPQATVNGEKFGFPLRYSEHADRCSWEHMQLVLESAFGK